MYNTACTDFYYGNNNRLTNSYGLQVVSVDPQTGIPQSINQQSLGIIKVSQNSAL